MAAASEDHLVTIRVWLPEGRPSVKGVAIGHTSLQTYGEAGIYASFWPEGAYSRHPRGGAGAIKTLEDDITDEGGMPDITVTLAKLNVTAINNAYSQFISEDFNWSIWASTGFMRYAKTSNCCGLVLDLLSVGGISEILGFEPSTAGLNTSTMLKLFTNNLWRTPRAIKDYLVWISPQGVAQIAKKAAKKERRLMDADLIDTAESASDEESIFSTVRIFASESLSKNTRAPSRDEEKAHCITEY